MISISCVLSRMLVDEQPSSVNPLQALNTHKGFEFRTTEAAAEAAAVTQHLPQGKWPDFRKGPLRPKTVRGGSRGSGSDSWGWRGRCREEPKEEKWENVQQARNPPQK